MNSRTYEVDADLVDDLLDAVLLARWRDVESIAEDLAEDVAEQHQARLADWSTS